MWSGVFSKRANDALITHSGLLCADLDAVNDDLHEVHGRLLNSPYLWALFVSPSGNGLKAVFRVPADAAKHFGSFRAIEKHVRELTGWKIDESGKDLARLCFISYDPEAYYNPNALVLEPLPDPEKPKFANNGAVNLSARQAETVKILGPVDWISETAGYCTCPGKHLHTQPDGARDCKIELDGAPTVHCFHNSCRGILDGVNRELRSRIINVERSSVTLQSLIVDAAAVVANPPPKRPDIIQGLLFNGGKMILGGSSKAYKTWLQIDQCAALATGTKFLGRFETQIGRVLYINFELPGDYFARRVHAICQSRGLKIDPGMFSILNLRGRTRSWAKLQLEIPKDHYSLIDLDPGYKLLWGRDENKASDIALLMDETELLAERTGAAVVTGLHFPKGNQSQKESLDRFAGSGVFGRDCDCALTITPHEEDRPDNRCFTVQIDVRCHPPQEKFVVHWEYPFFVVDDNLDPERLKQVGGRPRLATQTQILELLEEKPLTAGDWQKRANEDFGIAASTFWEMKAELVARGRVEKYGKVFSKA